MIDENLLTHVAEFSRNIKTGKDSYGNDTFLSNSFSCIAFLSTVSKKTVKEDGGDGYKEVSVLFLPPNIDIKKGDIIESVKIGTSDLLQKKQIVENPVLMFDDEGVSHIEAELCSLEVGYGTL